MSRLWDTPDFWVRSEADEMLRDCPTLTADALAERLERRHGQRYGDLQFVHDILAELRKRAYARVRFWPEPVTSPHCEAKASAAADPCPSGARGSGLHDERELELADGAGYWWQRM